MFWLLPVMALDMVDKVVMNTKMVYMLSVYFNTMTVSHLKTVIYPQMTLRQEESVLSKVLVIWIQVF